MVKLNTIGGMVATVAVGVALVQGCISAPSVGDPYFTQVKPTANVYAKQGQSGGRPLQPMPCATAEVAVSCFQVKIVIQ